MSPIAIIIILLVFNLLGRFISPPRHHTYRYDYERDFRESYMHPNRAEELERKAFSYTMIFVTLLMVAMFLAHDLLQTEVTLVAK